jgi:hypothetical protein
MPLKLTDAELDAVFAAAQPIPVSRRDAFLQDVAKFLRGCAEVGPGHVYRAIVEAQRAHFDPPLEVRGEPRHDRVRVGAALGRERSGVR